jgi:hypothetical protein
MLKPVLQNLPHSHRHPPDPPATLLKEPRTREPGGPKLWSFSFRFWRQIQYFGLDQTRRKWFVSLLEKLTELSGQSIESFVSNTSRRQNVYRYHPIDWSKKNVPISPKDLHWIDKTYTENETEYPLMQIQISKAIGRIVGFWDEHRVFNIVLLDPLHNIQPCKHFGYKVDNCWQLKSEHAVLLHSLEQARKHQVCAHPNQCDFDRRLDNLLAGTKPSDIVILRLDASVHEAARDTIDVGQAESMEDLIQAGVIACLDKQPKPDACTPTSQATD